LEFGTELGFVVSELEGSLLLDLLRKFEGVELLGCPFDWRLLTVLQRTGFTNTVAIVAKTEVAESSRCQVFANLPELAILSSSPVVTVGANITTLYLHGPEFNFILS